MIRKIYDLAYLWFFSTALLLKHCHWNTAIVALLFKYLYWVTAIEALPLNHCHWTTIIDPLPLKHCHWSTAIEPLPLNHCHWTTAIEALTLKHYQWCTAIQALPFKHCHSSTAIQALPSTFIGFATTLSLSSSSLWLSALRWVQSLATFKVPSLFYHNWERARTGLGLRCVQSWAYSLVLHKPNTWKYLGFNFGSLWSLIKD